MITLKHDEQGFLVGELVSGQRELLDYQESSLSVWRNIRTDVRAIARFLSARGTKAAEPAGRTAGTSAGSPAATRAGARADVPRDTLGRFVSTVRAVTPQRAREDQTNAEARPSAVAVPSPSAGPAVVAERDGRGRFTGKDRPEPSGPKHEGDGDVVGLGAKIADGFGNLKNALQGFTQGAEQVDPVIAAAHEVKEVVAPLGRGAFAMMGRTAERKKERWFSRILKALTRKKPDEPAPAAGNPDSGLGIGAVAGGIARLIPLLLKGGLALLGAGLAAALGTKIGGAIYDWLDRSGIATKIFDAFDAARDWIMDKVGKAKAMVGEFNEARNLAREGLGTKGQAVLDASGRNLNDPRRLDLPTLRDEPTSVAQKIGRAVGNAQRGADYMRRQVSRSPAENRALITGRQYKAGNIAGLDDAQTRALVASTVATESGGGNLGVVNPAGYMGRYQAGAGWLADAGLIKGGPQAVKAAMRADGFKNEFQWGKAGGMTRFLQNDSNWKDGLSYSRYLRSADVQDAAFKTNSDKAYAEMLRKGIVTPSTPQAEVAGLLKARHIAGMRGVEAVAAGGTGPADANRTTARKYFDDLMQDRGRFVSAYAGNAATAGAMRSGSGVTVPSAVPERLPVAAAVAAPLPPPPEKDKPVVAAVREPIGQDVGDRIIAHIVSGGIGGAGS